ncbi:MAG: EAL domain-containing protein, partial [Deltaproteobacteria bacterium]
AKFYEKGDWRNVKLLSSQMNINEDKLPDLYLKAVEWGNSLSSL